MRGMRGDKPWNLKEVSKGLKGETKIISNKIKRSKKGKKKSHKVKGGKRRGTLNRKHRKVLKSG